jgi:hypothetical protein
MITCCIPIVTEYTVVSTYLQHARLVRQLFNSKNRETDMIKQVFMFPTRSSIYL